jgi:hypothetical protein
MQIRKSLDWPLARKMANASFLLHSIGRRKFAQSGHYGSISEHLPTIASYSASTVKIYSAMSSLMLFENKNKNNFFYLLMYCENRSTLTL